MPCHTIIISQMRHLKANIRFNKVLSGKHSVIHMSGNDTGPKWRIQAVNHRTHARPVLFFNRSSIFDACVEYLVSEERLTVRVWDQTALTQPALWQNRVIFYSFLVKLRRQLESCVFTTRVTVHLKCCLCIQVFTYK